MIAIAAKKYSSCAFRRMCSVWPTSIF